MDSKIENAAAQLMRISEDLLRNLRTMDGIFNNLTNPELKQIYSIIRSSPQVQRATQNLAQCPEGWQQCSKTDLPWVILKQRAHNFANDESYAFTPETDAAESTEMCASSSSSTETSTRNKRARDSEDEDITFQAQAQKKPRKQRLKLTQAEKQPFLTGCRGLLRVKVTGELDATLIFVEREGENGFSIYRGLIIEKGMKMYKEQRNPTFSDFKRFITNEVDHGTLFNEQEKAALKRQMPWL